MKLESLWPVVQSRLVGLFCYSFFWCLVGVLSLLEHALNSAFVEFGQTILLNEVVEAKLVGPHPNDRCAFVLLSGNAALLLGNLPLVLCFLWERSPSCVVVVLNINVSGSATCPSIEILCSSALVQHHQYVSILDDCIEIEWPVSAVSCRRHGEDSRK
jgi:hypothetical protein